jgi:carboxypeptidase family protein
MRTVLCLLSGLLVATVLTGAQVPASPRAGIPRDNPQSKGGTARLSGRVVASDTGKPLRRAVVQVAVPGVREPRWAWTDADGRWQLTQMPAGRLTLTVSKSGYLTLRYGQLRPFEPGKVLEVADGQVLEKLDVSLPKGGVIAGRIQDEFGDPVSGALVRAMRYRYAEGQRRLMPMAEGFDSFLAGGVTDDIGQYRLHGLPPGEYYVSVGTGPPSIPSGPSDDRTGYAPSFYPGTASLAEAQRVTVAVGQEAQNVSFSMTPIRFSTVSGTIISSNGQPVEALNIWLSATGANAGASQERGTGRPDGTFVVSNVVPGEYRLRVLTTANGQSELASMPVTVAGQDITGLTVALAPGAVASGRVTFEGDPQERPRVSIAAFSASPGIAETYSSSAGVQADGTFELRDLSERQLFRLTFPPPEWFLKAVTLDGRDIIDAGYEFRPGERVSGIDVVLTKRSTALSGSVQDDRGRPVTDYTVVAFPTESSKWGYRTRFVRAARPDQAGRFLLKDLPPGEYQLIALEYIEPGEEADPDRLEKWKTRGTPVTLREGEATSVTLQQTR